MSLKLNITKTLSTLIIGTIIFILACQKDDPKPASLISISVKSAPSKIDYYVGETLDLSGLIITLHLDDESVKDVAFSDFMNEGILCSPENETILTAEITEVTITHTVSEIRVSQSITYNTLTDIDGNIYPLVKIGSQIWMAENLKTTKYNDGTAIEYPGNDNITWQNNTNGAYAWYNNDITYKETYGALYNYYTINSDNICPTGWHVYSNSEWITLTDYLGGSTNAAGKLKETGTVHWLSPNAEASNETGFTALPGGYRDNQGIFHEIGEFCYVWSSEEYDATLAYFRLMWYNNGKSYVGSEDKASGFSIRCIKD